MGLRCLIGHDYGDAQTERDRREQGSEVVVTVREFRECTRCGHRRILSENKEVRSEAGSEPSQAPSGDSPAEVSWSTTDHETAAAANEPVGSVTAGGADVGSFGEEPMTAEEDDGIILEDDADDPSPRAYGEWPDDDAEEAVETDDEPEPWPDDAPEPTRSTADAAGTSADASPEPTPDGPAAADPDDAAELLDAGGAQSTEASQPAPDPSPTEPEEPDRPSPQPDPSDVELVCPDCDETWPSVNVSLRPGDICPDCRKGYLEEQVLQ